MVRKPKRLPSFFKVLVGDFTNKLRIPPAFVKKFQNIIPETFIILKSKTRSYVVSVKDNEEGYFLDRGWQKFVRDHNLETGEFLVFHLVVDGAFQVVIYDATCCQKNLDHHQLAVAAAAGNSTKECANCSCQMTKKPQVSHKTTRDTGAKRGKNLKEDIDEITAALPCVDPKHPCFIKVFKDYQRYNIIIPSEFARRTGLACKKSTVLKDPKGRVWPIDIRVVSNGRRFHLSSGFSDFVEANGLVYGDTCVFQFMEDMGNAIHVQIHSKQNEVMNKNIKKPLQPAEIY